MHRLIHRSYNRGNPLLDPAPYIDLILMYR
jgi:hypothetical protein